MMEIPIQELCPHCKDKYLFISWWCFKCPACGIIGIWVPANEAMRYIHSQAN